MTTYIRTASLSPEVVRDGTWLAVPTTYSINQLINLTKEIEVDNYDPQEAIELVEDSIRDEIDFLRERINEPQVNVSEILSICKWLTEQHETLKRIGQHL